MKPHNRPDTNAEINFGLKVRQALNENLEQLPRSTVERLATARKFALTRKKKSSLQLIPNFIIQMAGRNAGSSSSREPWLGKMGWLLPILVLVTGLIGLYHYEAQQRINEIADIDALVLSDELPLSAYLDDGFSAYLDKRGE